jgi:hypothetical protein
LGFGDRVECKRSDEIILAYLFDEIGHQNIVNSPLPLITATFFSLGLDMVLKALAKKRILNVVPT